MSPVFFVNNNHVEELKLQIIPEIKRHKLHRHKRKKYINCNTEACVTKHNVVNNSPMLMNMT